MPAAAGTAADSHPAAAGARDARAVVAHLPSRRSAAGRWVHVCTLSCCRFFQHGSREFVTIGRALHIRELIPFVAS